MVVLVTGAKGQLGQAIQFISGDYPEMNFVFCDSMELDITNLEVVAEIFRKYKPNYCINTAAYTAVDKAESEFQKAETINKIGAHNLAKICKINNTILFHISTDFVFDGEQRFSYTEIDIPNPKGVYGKTKLEGEFCIQDTWEKHFIIRTSWLYSQFGNNFMKTMLRLGSERNSLSVVNDQIGTPTYAVDLAEALLNIIIFINIESIEKSVYGIYNFSNEGQCSWYDFANEIFKLNSVEIVLKPIPTESYPTPAKRPRYSVLDKSKIKTIFGIKINTWQTSLKVCLCLQKTNKE